MNKKETISGSIVGLIALLVTVAFLIIGFAIPGAWSVAWLLFLIIPIVAIIMDIIKNRGDWEGKVTGIVALFCTVAYLLMGFLGEELFGQALWHPGWIIFFAIPITSVIMKMVAAGKAEDKGEDAQGSDQP